MTNSKQVDLNCRFNNAWAEVNNRLTLRQNAMTVYATLMSIVFVGMGIKDKDDNVVAPWMVWFVPILSLIFAFLVYMHDSIIKNLCLYLRDLEERDNADMSRPNYLSNKKYSDHDNEVRVYHHIACALIIIAMNGIVCFLVWKTAMADDSLKAAFFIFSFLAVCLALYFVLSTICPWSSGDTSSDEAKQVDRNENKEFGQGENLRACTEPESMQPHSKQCAISETPVDRKDSI